MFKYALDKSFEELKATLINAKSELNNDELKLDVNYRLGTTLHWMMNFWERNEDGNTDLTNQYKSLFRAFRYANNELKHGRNLATLYQRTGGFSFPISFPLSFESIEFKWAELSLSDEKYRNQFVKYQTLLSGKPLVDALTEAKRFFDTLALNCSR